MNGLTEIHGNIPLFVILALFGVSVFLAFRFYRETIPPLALSAKYILISFRALLLFLVAMLILNPQLSWTKVDEAPRRIGLYIDNSASMGINTNREKRADSLQAILKAINPSLKNFTMGRRYYNTRVVATDSLLKPMGGTNFSLISKDARKQHWDAVLLISDGVRTAGEAPETENIPPVFAIGLGAVNKSPDIFIKQVLYPSRVVQGRKQQVTVHLANRSVSTANVAVRLYSGTQVLARKTVEIKHADSEQNIVFNYTPVIPGEQKLKVTLDAGIDEQEIRNNRYDFIWDVKKSAIRVGLISMAPNIEHKFFNFALSKDRDFETHSLTILPGVHLKQKDLDSVDVMVWQDFPTLKTSAQMWQKVTDVLRKNRPGLILFLNKRNDSDKLKQVLKLLGLNTLKKRSRPMTGLVTVSTPLSPLMDVFQQAPTSLDFWAAIPPVNSYYDLQPMGESLANMDSNPAQDLILLSNKRGRKNVVLNLSPFWKAHFALYDQTKISGGYTRFIQGIVRWASDHKKLEPVVLETNKRNTSPGAEIILTASIYDLQGDLIKNGQLTLTAQKKGNSFQIPVHMDSSGVFSARYAFNETGDFTVNAAGSVDGVSYGTARQMIHVTPFNPEFVHTLQDSAFLKNMARSTGGAYLTLKDIDKLPTLLGNPNKKLRKKIDLDLRYNTNYLYVILLLLAIEWIVRKRVKLI